MNIETIKSVYFVGAGGIGMSALVRYFLFKGKVVAGYDRTPTPLTEALIAEGAQIHYEENVDLIPEACKEQRKYARRIHPRRPTGTRRTGLLPQQRIRDTKTRSGIGNDYTFEQRLVM